MKSSSPRCRSAFLAGVGLAVTLAAMGVRANELHIAAANSSTNALYEVNFGPTPPAGATPLAITPIPPSGGSSVRSLVYVSNEQTTKVDLIAADTTGGKIVRYANSTGPALPRGPATGQAQIGSAGPVEFA